MFATPGAPAGPAAAAAPAPERRVDVNKDIYCLNEPLNLGKPAHLARLNVRRTSFGCERGSVLVGPRDRRAEQFAAVFEVQLVADAGPVGLDGLDGDVQPAAISRVLRPRPVRSKTCSSRSASNSAGVIATAPPRVVSREMMWVAIFSLR